MRPEHKYLKLLGFLLLCGLCCGCDPINRHKVLSTIFDGVPSLPPPQQMCEEYAEQRVADAMRKSTEGADGAQQAARQDSVHPPYAEKRCNDCHDKTTESGFVSPKKELCFVCHTGFIKGTFVHGPVAAADCLFCHEPHNANVAPLLKVSKEKLCVQCHRENRIAASLHERARNAKMICLDCHNPHYGNDRFFLK